MTLRFSGHDFIPLKTTTQKPKCLGSVQPQVTRRKVDTGGEAPPWPGSRAVLLWPLDGVQPLLGPGNVGHQSI